MSIEFLLLTIIGLSLYGYYTARNKANTIATTGTVNIHSQPHYHGLYSAFLTIIPAFILLILWSWIETAIFTATIRDFFSDINDSSLISFYVAAVKEYAN